MTRKRKSPSPRERELRSRKRRKASKRASARQALEGAAIIHALAGGKPLSDDDRKQLEAEGRLRLYGREPIEFHALANIFPLIEGAEFEQLVADVRARGLLEAVVLYEGKILDGRNRYRAALAADRDARFETYEGSDAVGFVIAKNLRRRHMDSSQRALAAAKLEQFAHGGRRRGEVSATLTRDKAAELLQVSKRGVTRAAIVRDKAAPELAAAVERGEVSVTVAAEIAAALPKDGQGKLVALGEKEIEQAYKAIRLRKNTARREQKVERLITIAQGNAELALPQKMALLVADPPWRYERPLIGDSDRSIENKYPTMPLADICAMPVHRFMAPAAMLALFVTAPQLFIVTASVCKAWGDPHWDNPDKADPKLWFTPRAQIVWDKVKLGMGHYVRTQHEFLILATRGGFPLPKTAGRPRSVLRVPSTRKHSEKPDAIFELLRRMYPEFIKAGLAAELFARAPRAGFHVWGNQAPALQEAAA